jgi:glucose-6-phosphate 1-dehydrogenase
MQGAHAPEPLAVVIFGGTGDLTRRMLMPALFRLWCGKLLPEHFALVGTAVEEHTDESYRDFLRGFLPEDADAAQWPAFAERIRYVGGSFDRAETFQALRDRLEATDEELGTQGNHLYYLAVPPRVIATIAEQLGRAGMVAGPEDGAWTRVVVEKPFGRDLESARELDRVLHRTFDERQIYRIDHYLGKETVQNLLVFRFANVIWEPVWNRHFVDHVQITVAEEVGVGTRAGYFEQAGVLRDMVQNHLLQLLTLLAMEPPAAYDADSVRNEKVKVLHSVRHFTSESISRELVRGQYGPGRVGGEEVPGYRQEPGVASDSTTETYVALRLWIDNWRWADVPFFLRTGKRLAEKATEIVIRFRPAPHPILDVVEGDLPAPNVLVLRIQPHEGISLRFEAKTPGLAGPLQQRSMDFDYREAFHTRSPAAYERLLLDAMLGDATLFARTDEVQAAWAIVTPILRGLEAADAPPVETYDAGSWGPPGADALLHGRRWRVPEPATLAD